MNRTGTLVAGLAALAAATLCLAETAALKSGVDKGGMLSAYHPTHVTGQDKNTNTCPVCNYPFNPAVQVWINADDTRNVSAIVSTLEKEMHENVAKRFKAFVVFINPRHEKDAVIQARLKKLAAQDHVKDVALVYLPGPDDGAVKDYAINTSPRVKNTIFVYKHREVEAKFVNLVANSSGTHELEAAIKSVVD